MDKRTFTDSEAARSRVALMIGLMGPSRGGKTYSALRLATGIQRVSGGEIFVLDTEARRSTHYAPKPGEGLRPGLFRFRHVDFGAPYSPLDYRSALDHCVERGAKVLVIDSMSHEHEGEGGVLDWHEREKTGGNGARPKKDPGAWTAPKRARQQLINRILQLDVHLILCFRAKEKIKWPPPGGWPDGTKDPKHLGWGAIGGEEFVWNMTAFAFLPPGADGVPLWQPETRGEHQIIALPRQFLGLLDDGRPLDEDKGEAMARWAAGGAVEPAATQLAPAPVDPIDDLRERYRDLWIDLTELVGDKAEAKRLLKAAGSAPVAGMSPATLAEHIAIAEGVLREHREAVETPWASNESGDDASDDASEVADG